MNNIIEKIVNAVSAGDAPAVEAARKPEPTKRTEKPKNPEQEFLEKRAPNQEPLAVREVRTDPARMDAGILADAKELCPDKLKKLDGLIAEARGPLAELETKWQRCYAATARYHVKSAKRDYEFHKTEIAREVAEHGDVQAVDAFDEAGWIADYKARQEAGKSGMVICAEDAAQLIRPIRAAHVEIADTVFREYLNRDRALYSRYGIAHQPSDFLWALRQAVIYGKAMLKNCENPGNQSPKAMVAGIIEL